MDISRIRNTFTKALGVLGQGQVSGLSTSNWDLQEKQTTAVTTEYQLTPTQWFAQRFTTTSSAGRLLFQISMRRPVGVGIPTGSTLDVSLYNDTNTGPSGLSLSGAFLPEQIVQWIAGSIFTRPQPGKVDPAIQGGFIQFPLLNVNPLGTDAVEGGSNDFPHYFEFPNTPGQLWLPNKSYWFVMRTTSFSGNLYVAKVATQQTTRYTYDGSGNQSSSTSDFGDLFGHFVNTPGAAQVFNFNNGESSAFAVYSDKSLSNPVSTPSQGSSAQLIVVEPITGIKYPATSIKGQDHIASEISFTTSVVARRNQQGFVDVAFPMSAGTAFSHGVDGLARMTYSCEITYNSFK